MINSTHSAFWWVRQNSAGSCVRNMDIFSLKGSLDAFCDTAAVAGIGDSRSWMYQLTNTIYMIFDEQSACPFFVIAVC